MEDVIIIGGGVCGCSLLYELSRYRLNTLLLERENDVACGTTKGNSAIIHAGYDPEPDTEMARLNVEGNVLTRELCRDLDILFKNIGSLVVGFNDEDRESIQKLLEKGVKNGVPGLRIVEGEELFKMEPNLSREVVCALYAPTAGIVCPWEMASAQAECAVQGGGKVELDCEVTAIKKEGEGFTVKTSKGDYRARFVVNAAGVDSDLVSQMLESRYFTITPKSGEYFVLDTTEEKLVNMTVFPCPSKLGKGVLVSPTVHGNIIAGPDSKNSPRGDYSCTAAGLEYVRKNALRCVPGINFRASIRNFSGLRADAGLEDFIVGESREVPGFFNIAAVKSPGLTSSPAIAREIAGQIKAKGLAFEPNPHFVAKRKIKRFHDMNEGERRAAIKENPLYGTIVCRCETVTEGEIVDALNRPLPPRSLDAVKRRCRPGTGRCQGGFCGPKVLELISRHYNVKPEEIPKDRKGMYIVTGPTKKTQTSKEAGGAK
ncbi:MAG: NAD(P)/FAD-dependent oxidoreductase [Treponema sp.]|jgi:glycerol-3-phosphate dehydrogenase|nr:NAD(P)/FAD-dependent oxidoreductase [Treponema sp.]